MRYLDHTLAWILFANAIIFVRIIETNHLRGAVLEDPIIWILVAMINFLRLRNGVGVRGLGTLCIGANMLALLAELVRLKMFGSFVWVLTSWGPYTLIAGAALSAELIFSLVQMANSKPHQSLN